MSMRQNKGDLSKAMSEMASMVSLSVVELEGREKSQTMLALSLVQAIEALEKLGGETSHLREALRREVRDWDLEPLDVFISFISKK